MHPKLLAELFFEAFILGIMLGLLYSSLHLLRVLLFLDSSRTVPPKISEFSFPWIGRCLQHASSKKRGRIFLFLFTLIEDVLFCLCAVIGVILLAYVGNNGRIRWFMPLGVSLGFAFFALTFGKMISYFSAILSAILRVITKYIIFVLLFPFRLFMKGLRKIVHATLLRVRKQILSARDRRFHNEERCALLDAASVGFNVMTSLGFPQITPESDHKEYKKEKRRSKK